MNCRQVRQRSKIILCIFGGLEGIRNGTENEDANVSSEEEAVHQNVMIS